MSELNDNLSMEDIVGGLFVVDVVEVVDGDGVRVDAFDRFIEFFGLFVDIGSVDNSAFIS